MRFLVTNDDGVRAPGIAALAATVEQAGHEPLVVAPMIDYSGASSAIGPVHSRDGVDYATYPLEDLPDVPAYGIDGPPALAVILACVGAFGRIPDAVVSGINHGANVGRSALHSGTIGAALTGAQFGLCGLAASIRFGPEPVPWGTPATLVTALLAVLDEAPPATVLNLNVPDVALFELRGLRSGRLGNSGTIRSAVHEPSPDADMAPGAAVPAGPARSGHLGLPLAPTGTLKLDLAPPWHGPIDLQTDAGLVGAGYASITPLVGIREDLGAVDGVVAKALGAVEEVTGIGPGL